MNSLNINLETFAHFSDLTLADPIPRDNAKIDYCLGCCYYFQLKNGKIFYLSEPDIAPLAVESFFGWVLAGPSHKKALNKVSVKCVFIINHKVG